MSKQKSTQRRLAERIASEKGIKVKSAMRYLQRARATGDKEKIKNPRFSGLPESLAKRAKSFVKQERIKAEPKPERQTVRAQPGRRRLTAPDKKAVVSLKATFDFYGNDRRHRTINLEMFPEEIEDLLDAGSIEQALNVFQNAERGQFLKDAEIYDFEYFKLNGETIKNEFFEN